MYCKNCGATINGTSKFCPKCGKPVSVQPQSAPEPEPYFTDNNYSEVYEDEFVPVKKKKKKVKWILIGVLVLVVLLAGGGAVAYATSPPSQVVKALNNGEYANAAEIYNEEVAGNFIWRWLSTRMLENFLDSTVTDYESGELTYEEAVARFNALSALGSETISASASEYLERISILQDSQEAFEEAESLYSEGEYMEAAELYAQVSEDSSLYEEAQTKLDECHDLYVAEVLEMTSDPVSQSDYRSCLSIVNIAVDVFPEDEDLLRRQADLEEGYQTLVKSDAMSEANEAVASSDYESAISVLEDALEVLPEDSELTSMLNSARSAYEESIVSQANTLVDNGDYDGALALLSEALGVLPDSETLSQLYDTTEANQPVKLSSLKLSESSGRYELITDQVVTMDTLGNTYNPGNLYRFWGGDGGYVKYYLGGAYTTLRLTLAVSDEDEDRLEPTTLTIYGDNDVILYTSGELTRTSTPQTVSVDVTGQNWLYIRSGGDSSYRYAVSLLVADPILYK